MGIKDYKTVNNFAKENAISISYVYKLIREGKLKKEVVDGVIFIDASKNKIGKK